MRRAPAWIVLVLAAVAGCGDAPAPDDASAAAAAIGAAPTVTDAEGRTLALAAPARRVVSLVPSVTATILALDAGDRLVGRTDFDTAAVLADRPTVGGGLGPDLETLAALDPDLVVRFAGASDRATPDRLDDLGIAHVAVRPDRIDDVFTVVEQVGVLLGLESAARRLAEELEAGLDGVRASVAGRPPVRAAYLMGGSPPWTAGAGTYIDELIAVAGGRNVLDDVEGLYGAVSPEVVATRPVDVVLLADGARVDPRLLEGRRVRHLPPSVQLPGPDLVAAAQAVARALHPDLAGEGRRP